MKLVHQSASSDRFARGGTQQQEVVGGPKRGYPSTMRNAAWLRCSKRGCISQIFA